MYRDDGKVCISILHPPGDDEFGYESASERWNPIHTVESIILSVITMLADPNDESPADVDCAKEMRDNYDEFKKKVKRCVRRYARLAATSSTLTRATHRSQDM